MAGLTARELLAQADHHRRVADATETARSKIRLSQKPVARGGLLGFLRPTEAAREVFFTVEETEAIYRALAVVRQDEERWAHECEERVTLAGGR